MYQNIKKMVKSGIQTKQTILQTVKNIQNGAIIRIDQRISLVVKFRWMGKNILKISLRDGGILFDEDNIVVNERMKNRVGKNNQPNQ